MGFSTYNTTAKFNKVAIAIPYGQQPFTETFSDGIANGFSSPEGTFVVSNGTYVDTAVHQIGTASPPVNFGAGTSGVYYYTLHVRMRTPMAVQATSSGSCSRPAARAITRSLFSPTGLAQVRHVNAGTIEVLNSVPHTIPRNVWFEVTLTVSFGRVSVNLNGDHLFTQEIGVEFLPDILELITHWTPGRFDDFSSPHTKRQYPSGCRLSTARSARAKFRVAHGIRKEER